MDLIKLINVGDGVGGMTHLDAHVSEVPLEGFRAGRVEGKDAFSCGYKIQAIGTGKQWWFEVWQEPVVCGEMVEGTVGGMNKIAPVGELGEADMCVMMCGEVRIHTLGLVFLD